MPIFPPANRYHRNDDQEQQLDHSSVKNRGLRKHDQELIMAMSRGKRINN
ncbi:Uncharacterised protein [Vibrio cholerae]|nr:Uncharacterised protein [Vibrio cholerae]